MTAVDELVYLLEQAFAGVGIEASNESQSLLANLATVDQAQWRVAPTGGERTIGSICLHVGSCIVMYDDYAFGPGRLRWDDPEVQPWARDAAPMSDTIAWLRRGHERFVEHVRALPDEELSAPRLTNWGERRETRWLISTVLQHDTYHAGEINHVRSLLAGSDAWRWG
jgi:uncharacterized damage-inducible protein DinB